MNEFFAPFYEFFYYSVPFSDDIFQEGQYAPIGIIAVATGLIMGFLFYGLGRLQGLSRPKLAHWYYWLLFGLITFGVNFLVGTFFCQAKFTSMGLNYNTEYYMLGYASGTFSFCVYFIYMILFRWFSTNSRLTPVPH